MHSSLRIGIIGDFNPANASHLATNEALQHAAGALSVVVEHAWIPTQLLEFADNEERLQGFDGLFCAPGSPYTSMQGALNGIRFARQHGKPFVGTWGGYQHTLLEYARNELGMQAAEHEETSPNASSLVISKLVCSLVGQEQTITILPGSIAYQAYQKATAMEKFRCNYGLNPAYQDKLLSGRLKISGLDDNGDVRIIELSGHPFFIATLFIPQLSSLPGAPHPLMTAYLKAAMH